MIRWIGRTVSCLYAVGVSGAICGAAFAATGQSAPDTGPITLPLEGKTSQPTFKVAPSGDDISREYPGLANFMHISGRVVVSCDVAVNGAVGHCDVVSEKPAGLGFGAGALRIASSFQLNPATIDGAPVKGRMTVPIRFMLDRDAEGAIQPEDAPPATEVKMALARRLAVAIGYRDATARTLNLYLETMSAQLASSGRSAETQAALDAVHHGVEDASVKAEEIQAKRVAASMSEADLAAAVAFLESPAGQSLMALNRSSESASGKAMLQEAAADARARFCASTSCDIK